MFIISFLAINTVLANPKKPAYPIPKLVVFISVDQGRYDYPWPRDKKKYQGGYGHSKNGGYVRFFNGGVIFKNAFYAHSGTLTEQGHVTLVTGGNPRTSGIPSYGWYHYQNRGKSVNAKVGPGWVNDNYDPNYKIIGKSSLNFKGLWGSRPGTAPAKLLQNTSTIGDALIQQYGKNSNVYAVGMWSWPTINMAGKEGKAFWYDYTSAEMVSSNFFFKDNKLPDWVIQWNKTHKLTHWLKKSVKKQDDNYWYWSLLEPNAQYKNFSRSKINRHFVKPPCYPASYYYDDPKSNKCFLPDVMHLGISFFFDGHKLKKKDINSTKWLLLYTPYADQYVAEFAYQTMVSNNLGKHKTPDLLFISFSSLDMVGHMYGPDSMEHEDAYKRLDKMLGKLINNIKSHMGGLDDVLIIITADHGVHSIPEYVQAKKGINAAGRVNNGLIEKNINLFFQKKYAETVKDNNLFFGIRAPSIYIDIKFIENNKDKMGSVEDVMKALVADINHNPNRDKLYPGIEQAWTKYQLMQAKPPFDSKYQKLMKQSVDMTGYKNNGTDRSGQILVRIKRNWYFYEDPHDAAMHGSPYDLDRHVQLMMLGGPLKKSVIKREVHLRDVTPTLLKVMGSHYLPKASNKNNHIYEILDAYEVRPKSGNPVSSETLISP